MFGIRTIVADGGSDRPREGDRFLMQTFFEKSYSQETLLQLNRVRVYCQALFVSDILTASSNKIDSGVLGQPQVCHKRSRLWWPTEHPTTSNFQTWRDAVMALCPSWNTRTRLGSFIVPTHRIWEWRWDERSGYLCQYSNNGDTDDVLLAGKKPNTFHYLETRPSTRHGIICLVEPTHVGQVQGGWRLTSLGQEATAAPAPQTFMDMLQSWGNTWLWENI